MPNRACPRPAHRSHGTTYAHSQGCRCATAIEAKRAHDRAWRQTPAGQAKAKRDAERDKQSRLYIDQAAIDRALAGRPTALTRRERWEAITQGTAARLSAQKIADLIGVTTRTVVRHRAARRREAASR